MTSTPLYGAGPRIPQVPDAYDWPGTFRKAGDAIGPMVGKFGPLLAGATEFADQTPGETPLGNTFDAVGATAGGWAGAEGLVMLGAKVAPHPLAKAALMALGLTLGSGVGKNLVRGIGDLATGGATRNTPENQALRNQQQQFQQNLNQSVLQAQTMIPLMQQQGLIQNQLNNLAQDAQLRRQMDLNYANALYGGVLQAGGVNSAATANAFQSVLNS